MTERCRPSKPARGRVYVGVDVVHSAGGVAVLLTEADNLADFAYCFLSAFACLVGALSGNLVEEFFVGRVFLDAFTDRLGEFDDILSELFLEVAIADRAVVPFFFEELDCVGFADDVEESEEVLYDLWLFAVRCDRSAIGNGLHDFFLDSLSVVFEVDAVAFALAHFARAVESWDFDSFLREVE